MRKRFAEMTDFLGECEKCLYYTGYMTVQTTTNKFHDFIRESEVPVLVDFFADWCGPCHMLSPILKDLKSGWGDKIRLIKVDTEAQPEIAREFQISGIPTLILFKNGQAVHRTSGVMPLAKLQAEFGRFVA